jgi:hypothetical protein
MKKTKWYEPDNKPLSDRPGVYDVYSLYMGSCQAYWNGKVWCPVSARSRELAKQNWPWRGLAEKP